MYEIITLGRILCPVFSAFHWNDVLETVSFFLCAVDKNIDTIKVSFFIIFVDGLHKLDEFYLYTLYVCQ